MMCGNAGGDQAAADAGLKAGIPGEMTRFRRRQEHMGAAKFNLAAVLQAWATYSRAQKIPINPLDHLCLAEQRHTELHSETVLGTLLGERSFVRRVVDNADSDTPSAASWTLSAPFNNIRGFPRHAATTRVRATSAGATVGEHYIDTGSKLRQH